MYTVTEYVHDQPEVQLTVSVPLHCFLVFLAAAIFLESVHGKCLQYYAED